MTNLVIITGGSKGLGKALVTQYLAKGWTVRELSRSGDSAHHIDCDFGDAVASEQAVNDAFASLAGQSWSRVVLINNAGIINPIGPVETSEPSEWQNNVQINFNACIMTTGLFLKHFENHASARQIANISSGAALKPRFGWSLYCATKAGFKVFCECVAVEQSHKDNPIMVFSLRPGVVDTGMQQQIRAQGEDKFIDIEGFKKLKSDNQLRSAESVAKWTIERVDSNPEGGVLLDINDWD